MRKITFSPNIWTLFLLVLTGSLGSCKKLIQIPASPPSELPQQQIFGDSTDILSAVAGVYLYNRGAVAGFGYRDGDLSLFTGASSDELAQTTDVYDTFYPQLYSNTILSNNADVLNVWSAPYTSLYQVNVCIEGIQAATTISTALQQQLIGEMEVVRALYYFNLVNLFGGIPLVTTSNYQVNGALARSSVDSVYDLVLSDLTDAQKKLTPAYPSAGHVRPNLYVAEALLAKVYLYRGQWQNAYDAANQVIASGVYQLVPDPANVFLDGSAEAIWQLPANGPYSATSEASEYYSANGYPPYYPVSSALLSAFEPGDTRMQKWLGTSVVNSGTTTITYYYPYKYKNVEAASPTTEDFMVFRLAEQYLIRAEAAAELGNTAGALQDLNAVRARAGLASSTATASTLLAAIMHERQVELFSEWGNRWFDLKRWGTVNTVLSAEKPGWNTSTSLYPIPYNERQLDPFLTQNPGYQ
jgi:hypothetical protein